MATHRMGKLQFFSDHAGLAEPKAFQRWMAPLLQCEWGVMPRHPICRSKLPMLSGWCSCLRSLRPRTTSDSDQPEFEFAEVADGRPLTIGPSSVISSIRFAVPHTAAFRLAVLQIELLQA